MNTNGSPGHQYDDGQHDGSLGPAPTFPAQPAPYSSQPPSGYTPYAYDGPVPPVMPEDDEEGGSRWWLGLVGALLLLIAAMAIVDRSGITEVTGSGAYASAPTVELVATGAVTVRGIDGDDGVVVDRIGSGWPFRPSYSVREGTNRLVVEFTCPGIQIWSLRCNSELDVTVPSGTNVIVRTTNGAVVASGIAGDAELRTTNGRVDATDIGGRLDARSTNGAIDVHYVGGDVEARTTNGAATVSGVAGNVDARTTNGRVTVRGDGEPVRLSISTTNGSQTIQGATDPDADRYVNIRSTNGSVEFLGP